MEVRTGTRRWPWRGKIWDVMKAKNISKYGGFYGGTSKLMLYKGKSFYKWMITGDTPIYGNPNEKTQSCTTLQAMVRF